MLQLSFTSLHGGVNLDLVKIVVDLRRLGIHVRLELAMQDQPVVRLLVILGELLQNKVQYAEVLRYRDILVVHNLELVDRVGDVRGFLQVLCVGGARLSLSM